MWASEAVLWGEVISKKGARLTCTVSCQGRWGRGVWGGGGGGASEGVNGSAAHSCQLHIAWHSALS